jgi:colicin import membrane protein
MKSSGLKAMGGSTMKSEKSTPLFVNSPAKVAKKGDLIGQVVGDVSNIASSVSNMLKKAKDDFYKQREERLEKARTQGEKDKVLKDLPNSKLAETLEKIRKENEIKKPTSDKKSTTKGAGGKSSGEEKPGKKTFAQAYEIAKKKYPKAYGKMTLAQYTAEAKRQIANKKKTGKYIGGKKEETKTTPTSDTAASENLKKVADQVKLRKSAQKAEEAFQKEQAAKKKAAAEKKAEDKKKAAEEKAKAEYAKKNLKPRSRSRKRVKVDVVKDTKTGARLKTKTRTRKDGTVKTKTKETRIIGGVASKTRKVEDARKDQRKKDRQKRRSRVSAGSSPG